MFNRELPTGEGEEISDVIYLSNRYRNYIKLLATFALYVTVCAIFYTYYEGWQPTVALSFVVDTVTTVGYGYHHPSDDNSRLFTIFAMIFGVSVIFTGFSTAMSHRLAAMTRSENIAGDFEDVENVMRRLRRRVVLNILAVIVCLFAVATFFCWMEDWTFITAFYFAVQTATSVGYGDIPLKQHGTHIVVGVYEFLSVVLLTFAVHNIADIHQERKRQGKMLAVAERKQMLGQIEQLDQGDGVGEAEFVLAVLEQLGTIDRARDVEPWVKKFRDFDVNQTGVLRKSEIAQFSAAENVEGLVQATRIRNMQGSFDIPRLSKRSFAAWGSLSQPVGGLSSPTTGVALTDVAEEYPVNYNHYPSFGQQHSYSTSGGTTVSPLSQPAQPSQISRPRSDSLSDSTA